jgi:predicted PurR-regulated permease PerM
MEMDEERMPGRWGDEIRLFFWAQLGALIGFGALLFVLYQVYQVFQPFIAPMAWAIILGVNFHPLHRWLCLRMRGHKTLPALLATAVVMLTVVIPVLAMSGILTQQAMEAAQRLKEFAEAGGIDYWGERLRTRASLFLWQWVSPWIGMIAVDLNALIARALTAVADVIVPQMTVVAASVFVVAVKFLLMLLTLFFVFRDGEACYHWVRTTIPLSVAQQGIMFEQLGETVIAVTRGIGITAVVQGILAGLAYWVLGVPFAVFWGLLSAVVAPIPLGGTGLVWVPAAIYLMMAQSWVRGLMMLIWGIAVISMVDNVVKPWLIGGRAKLPTLFLFFAILGGVSVYGVLGVFLGPLLLALVITSITLYREKPPAGTPPTVSLT